MNTQKKLLLVTKSGQDARCARAIEFCRRNFSRVQIAQGDWGDPLPNAVRSFEGDYLLSYLSRWIIPAEILNRTKVAALNFHPAPPEYPGIGCTNFALYDNATEFGVTCHHMMPSVDAGEIVAVDRFPIFPSDNVESLHNRSHDYLLRLFYDVIALVAQDAPLPSSNLKWAREPYRRSELNAISEITPDMSHNEIRRRIRATAFGQWKPWILVNGVRFELAE